MENCYELLEIDSTNNIDKIRNAFHKKIKQYHPDICVGDKSQAEEMTEKLTQAYDLLRNGEKKSEHDKLYHRYKFNKSKIGKNKGEGSMGRIEKKEKRENERKIIIENRQAKQKQKAQLDAEKNAQIRIEKELCKQRILAQKELHRKQIEAINKNMTPEEIKIEKTKWKWDLTIYLSIGILVFFVVLFIFLK